MTTIKRLCLMVSLVLTTLPAAALTLSQEQVPEAKRSSLQQYLSPREAFDWKTKPSEPTFLIDVRTPPELHFVGFAPIMDVNIPYITYDYGEWDVKVSDYKRVPNSAFAQKIDAFLASQGQAGNKKVRLIFLCRSGDRSARAATLLAQAGYTNIWSILDGFEGDKAKEGDAKGKRVVNGWKNDGLPWSYDLTQEKAALLD